MNTGNSFIPVLTLLSVLLLSSCTNTPPDPISSDSVAPKNMTIQDTSTNSPDSHISKTVIYTTDHGKHRVQVQFDITRDSAGTIIASSATMKGGDRESRQYIDRFNSVATSQIVGKKISSLSLSAIGGASDTTDAFMQVVDSL